MHCINCQKNKSSELKKSAIKQRQERCEHCGSPINDRGQRLNGRGLVTDSKGEPKKAISQHKFVPPPRKWVKA